MRPYILAMTTLLLASILIFTACTKEETPPATKTPAIQAAEQAAHLADVNTGREVYEKSCAYCHTTGMLHAPVIGNKRVWDKLRHLGMEHLVENVIFGIGDMPPGGGDHNLSDDEIRLAVECMIEQSQ